MYTVAEFIEALQIDLEKERNDVDGADMARYMKNLFQFLGIKSPMRRQILKAHLKKFALTKDPAINRALITTLWDQPYREYQYCGLDILDRVIKYDDENSIEFLEKLIVTKSWWDTVDMLTGAINHVLEQDIDKRNKRLWTWIQSDNIWLQRSALIYFRHKKVETDWKLLKSILEVRIDSTEFFIQKAAGWALRSFSREEPELVRTFIHEHQLKPVTLREAKKYLS